VKRCVECRKVHTEKATRVYSESNGEKIFEGNSCPDCGANVEEIKPIKKVFSMSGFDKINLINEKYKISCTEISDMDDYHKWRDKFWKIHNLSDMIDPKDVAEIQRLENECEVAHHREMIVVPAKEITMLDVFEDRVKSLLVRWKTFRDKNPEKENIDSECIKGFLQEVNDEYTKSMMEVMPESIRNCPHKAKCGKCVPGPACDW
jgi:hypothetical protein